MFDGHFEIILAAFATYKERSLIDADCVRGRGDPKAPAALRGRFRSRDDNRRRFAKGRAISWNIRVLSRFECAAKLDVPIPSYGAARAGAAG